MFGKIISFFKSIKKVEDKKVKSKDTAKERLHLVLMQDRANVSVDFLELMKQEIIDVIKKYIEIDEGAIDVRLTNKTNDDGTNGAPALYANIPITTIKYNTEEISKKIKQDTVEKNDDIKEEIASDDVENSSPNVEEKSDNSEKKEENDNIENMENADNNEINAIKEESEETETDKEIENNINEEDVKEPKDDGNTKKEETESNVDKSDGKKEDTTEN